MRANRAGFVCRKAGWACFIWVGPDGIAGTFEGLRERFPQEKLTFGDGQMITPEGRAALLAESQSQRGAESEASQ